MYNNSADVLSPKFILGNEMYDTVGYSNMLTVDVCPVENGYTLYNQVQQTIIL